MEEWKDIQEHPTYEVSNIGNIRNKKTKRILKSCADNGGYLYVGLGSKCRHQKIHKLVATTFCSNINNYPVVDHIDRNKLNNNSSNLRWTTQQKNCWNSSRCINAKHIRTQVIKCNNIEYIYYAVEYRVDFDINISKRFKTLIEAEQYLNEIQIKYPRILCPPT
jgi:hypothetical protein